MDQVPLSEALICVNCSTIFRAPAQFCPHCAGSQFVLLERWLNRTQASSGPETESAKLKAA